MKIYVVLIKHGKKGKKFLNLKTKKWEKYNKDNWISYSCDRKKTIRYGLPV